LPPLIKALQHSSPDVELILTHEPFDYCNAFKLGELDAAIIVVQQCAEEWQNHSLYEEDVVYVCHPKRHVNHSLTLKELNTQAIITTEPGCTYRLRVEEHFKAHGLLFKPRQSFANVEVIRRCLLSNMGLGLLPRCVVEDDLANQRLKIQAVQGAPYRFYSTLVYPKGRSVAPKLKALIDVVELACGAFKKAPNIKD
jgi:DNA-binding transcriptional LysR family regulator